MRLTRRVLASSLALTLALTGVAACGDDPGEDEIGDGEIIDEGD
jgi:hypothetical protein